MPLYNLECTECGFIFEDIISIGDINTKCPQCESDTERLLSIPSIKMPGARLSTPVRQDGIKDDISVTTRIPEYKDRNTGKSLGFGTPESIVGC